MGQKKDEIPRIEPFNPLDKKNLGATVAEELLRQEMNSLPLEPFIGAGIYALYYTGPFPQYEPLVKTQELGGLSMPIYVGKAVPAGSRKGGFGLGVDPGQVLCKRLNEHARSIMEAQNLNLDDFKCRFVVVDDIWIPLGESLLIESYHPIWNVLVDGFGNHDPGKGRNNQKKSMWDHLHPGRPWANRLKPSTLSINEVNEKIAEYYKSKKS